MAALTKFAFFAVLTLQLIVFALYLLTNDFIGWYSNSKILRTTHSVIIPVSTDPLPVTPMFEAATRESNYTKLNKTIYTKVKFRTTIAYESSRTSKHNESGQNRDIWNETKNSTPAVQLDVITESKSYNTGIDSNEFFQPIDGKEAWLYSAYFDHVAAMEGTPLIRVFGVIKREFMKTVFCHFGEGSRQKTTTGYFRGFPDGHDQKFVPAYANCTLEEGLLPRYVSVTFLPIANTTNRLKVQYPGPNVRNFTVCYSILHSQYRNDSQLIFSIEMNRILGAEHFVVYNNSVSSNVDLILRQYQKDGLVTVLPWPIPISEIWYYGQMLALNDCFFRNRNSSRFVAVMDTDELIIPRSHTTWMELIDNVTRQEINSSSAGNVSLSDTKGQVPIGSFMVKSSFFTINSSHRWDLLPSQVSFTDEEKSSIIKFKMRWLLELWRSCVIYRHRIRSKYFARPELVSICGIHYVYKFNSGANYLNVSGNLAMVHHYRKQELLSELGKTAMQNKVTYYSKFGTTQDTSLLKFKHRLYPRLMRQYKRFGYLFT